MATTATPSEFAVLMSAATAAHKAGSLELAIEGYRRALAQRDDPNTAILLANVLATAPAPTALQQVVRAAEADALADKALAAISGVPDKYERAVLYSRHAHYIMTTKLGQEEDAPAADGKPVTPGPVASAIASLETAVALAPSLVISWRNLSTAYKLAGRVVDACGAAARAVAMCRGGTTATTTTSSASASGGHHRVREDLLYRLATAQKRIHNLDGACRTYVRVLEASPGHALSAFWLRVLLAEAPPTTTSATATATAAAGATASADGSGAGAVAAGGDGDAAAAEAIGPTKGASPVPISPETRALVEATLAKLAAAAGGGGGGGGDGSDAGSTAGATTAAPGTGKVVPNVYIATLFNGYSAKFESHLTTTLEYRTPQALAALAVAVARERMGTDAAATTTILPVVWQRCADLGCGTGLAGVAFQAHVASPPADSTASASASGTPAASGVGQINGVDLSSGMVAEAQRRHAGVYHRLDVGDVETWCEAEAAAAAAAASASGGRIAPYDLVVAADVLVYIGDLERVFAGAAAIMPVPGGSAASDGGAAVAAAAACVPRPPPLFVFSTEADLTEDITTTTGTDTAKEEEEEGAGPGFRLTGTGRCVHQRRYIRRLAAAHGFAVRAVTRQAIRKNAGKDVIGDLYVLERM